MFTEGFLIHEPILIAPFPQALALSAKATDVFSRLTVHLKATELDALQRAFQCILKPTQELQLLGPALTQLSATVNETQS